MIHNLTKKQIVSEANKIRSEFRRFKLEDKQKKFIKRFVKKNKKIIIGFLVLAIVETVVALLLPIISHFYLDRSFDLIIHSTFWIVGISLLLLVGIFLINSYFSIYFGEKLSMMFINRIREAWYIYYLKHSAAFRRRFDGSKLMTKFVYHIQLLKMELQNVLNEGIRAVLLYAGILVISFLFNSNLFLVLWVSLPVVLILFFITDYIGKHYIVREQTFNTRIVSLLAESLMNFDTLKSHSREDEKLKEMDNLIDLDTYFRIRRNLWLKYSNRLLYGFILAFGIALYFVQVYWPFFDLGSVTSMASTGIILGFFIRVLFAVSRSGIFFEAFRLGLYLSVPQFNYNYDGSIEKAPEWQEVMIKSQKTKFSKYSDYINNFELPVKNNSRIAIVSDGPYGKSTLAKIISGQKCIDSIIFKMGKQRVASEKWCKYKNRNCYISGTNIFDTTVGEYLLGKNNSEITHEDIYHIYRTLKSYKIFNFLLTHREVFGRPIRNADLSFSEITLLQIAHCILVPKDIIAIDHLCINQQNEQILKGLQFLDKHCPKSAIIAFSSSQNKILNYDKTYQLYKNEFKEV
jgi:ABC-type transport system involved in cytochrome bd biosynthesis fused ATPase/permease subunit